MLSVDHFATLFTREGLRPFQPKPGAQGLEPMLEVHTTDAILLFLVAVDDFNDFAARHGTLRALGKHCAATHEVVAVRFGSEAWMRGFRQDEIAARGNRHVASYDDKEEVIVVMGQMADGPGYMASASLRRRPTGKVASLGPWTVVAGAQHRSHLLEAFWEGYHAAKEGLC